MLGRRNRLSPPLAVVFICVLFSDSGAGRKFKRSSTDGPCTTPNRRPGTCIPASQCQFIEQALRMAPRRGSCCEPFNGQGRHGVLRTQSSKLAEVRAGVDPSERLSQLGMSVLNSEFAECNVGRVLVAHGRDTNLMEYTWVALLVYDDGISRSMECGGSLISDRHVLTAAHCILVRHPKKLVAVRLGEYDTRSDIDCAHTKKGRICAPPMQEIQVAEAVYHKDYIPSRFANDIGLLRLRKEVVFNAAVHPICLPIGALRKDLPLELAIAGWGHTEEGTRANVLQKASLPVVENDTCQKTYKIIPITDRHLCAGGVNATQSCRGDSGGPLFQIYDRVQYGIVSGGSRKCGTSFPDVYTRVEPFLPWISSNIAALM